MTSPRTYIGARILALVLAALAWNGAARAEGNGFKFGEGRIHPYLELEPRYDSAALLEGNSYIADLILHFRPGVKLEMPSTQFSVNLDGNLDYLLYTGIKDTTTRKASHLQGDADLNLGINSGGQLGLDLGDHVSRSDRLSPAIPVGLLSFYNDARAQLNLRPSGGALEIQPNYHLTTEFYSTILPSCSASDASCNSDIASQSNYLTHNFALTGRWKFLPKTAVVVDGAYAIRTYTTSVTPDPNVPINTLKATLGLAGLLTTHLSTVLKIGWGRDMTKGTFSSIVGQFELGYLLSESAQLKVGFVRTFEPISSNLVSYTDDRPYLDGRILLGGRMTVHATGSLDFLGFNAGPGGSLTNVSGELGVDFEVRQWLTLSAGDVVTYRSTSGEANLGTQSLTRNEVYARVRLIY